MNIDRKCPVPGCGYQYTPQTTRNNGNESSDKMKNDTIKALYTHITKKHNNHDLTQINGARLTASSGNLPNLNIVLYVALPLKF